MSGYEAKQRVNLTNPDKSARLFNLAKKAAQSGDYQRAIAALESILHRNPQLSNIRLELGVLYKRIGANDLAERYINEAIQSSSIPADVKRRALSLLEQASATKSPHSFFSTLSLSALYDNNANAGPADSLIMLGGIEQQLSKDTLGESDHSVEAIGTLQYRYDFKDQNVDGFEADLLSYNRHYDELSRLDTNVLDVKFGPRFNLEGQDRSVNSIKPYLGFNTSYLEGDQYKVGKAFGVNYRIPLTPKTLIETDLKVEEQDYSNSNGRLAASLRSGRQTYAKGQLTHLLTPKVRLYGKVGASRRNSEANFESFDEINAGIGIRYEHDRRNRQARPSKTSLSVDWRDIDYDEPDMEAGFAIAREEEKILTRLSNNMPISDNTSVNTSISYTNNESETVFYDYDNWGASVGVSFATY